MMAASNSELNYYLTLKMPHLFWTFFDRNLSNIWQEAAARCLCLSFCSRRPIVPKQINGDFLGQCTRCYVGTTWSRAPQDPPPSYAPESKPIAFLPISLPSLLSLLISSLIMHYEYLHHNESTAGH